MGRRWCPRHAGVTSPNDLTDAGWNVLQPLTPPESLVGRPRKWSLQEILASIFSVLRGGRGLAGDGLTIFPPGKQPTTRTGCGGGKACGKRCRSNCVKVVRVREGRPETPSAGMIDSQSVITTEAGGHVVTTAVRRSMDGSVICSWIRPASSWRSKCMKRTSFLRAGAVLLLRGGAKCFSPNEAPVGGCGIHRKTGRRTGNVSRLDAGDREASLVRTAEHLGTERRTSTTCGGARGICGVETAPGRGADLCLALEIQAHGQGR
ncbi:Putative transposase of IS4/5 family [Deinococcus hopiensis KR-140]|uniref:Putative transposase of IS4/5 family n=1 Tax=Deinococcus hopiensis KR-140 TaxID=695939 RepID=A0A1W1UTQ0_9DEIO|nr:Putative transposase of IS4/5 family [Deinococcus hopiensis KR-140]